MAKTKEKKEPSVILSLVDYNSENIGVAVTSDSKSLADGIYSFLTMCMDGRVPDITYEHARGIMIGVGEWLSDLPVEISSLFMEFLAECISSGEDKMIGNKKCDC